MKKLAMLAAVAATLIVTAACAEDQEAAVAARVAELSEAYRVADVAALEGMIAAPYSHINNGGEPIDRDGWLGWNRTRADYFAGGAWEPVSYEVSELAISFPDGRDDVAVVTGRVYAEEIRDGENTKSDIRFTNLWIVEDGAWKRAAFHDSPAR